MTATGTRPAPAGNPGAEPPGRLRGLAGRAGRRAVRVVWLLGLLAASGVALGLAAAVPLSLLDFDSSSAQRLDQSRLAGQIEVADALVGTADLPRGWGPGDPALSAFGMIGSEFCGEKVPIPGAATDVASVVWVNPTDDATLIAQAVRVDRWQAARDYVADVGDALRTCDEFFRAAPGGRVRVRVTEASGTPPITDYTAATYVAADPQSVQEFSVLSVGDLIIAISHSAPTRPAPGFLNGVEAKLLARIDPADFAPGGIPTDTTTGDDRAPAPATTSPGAGAADESDTGGPPGGGP